MVKWLILNRIQHAGLRTDQYSIREVLSLTLPIGIRPEGNHDFLSYFVKKIDSKVTTLFCRLFNLKIIVFHKVVSDISYQFSTSICFAVLTFWPAASNGHTTACVDLFHAPTEETTANSGNSWNYTATRLSQNMLEIMCACCF